MADITRLVTRIIDLDKKTKIEDLPPLVSGEGDTKTIHLTCKRGSENAEITGAVCRALIRNQNNQTFVLDGAVTGNIATVLLTDSCSAVQGRLLIIVTLEYGGAVTPLYYANTVVYQGASDIVIDEGDVVPSLSELLAQISNCESATAAAIAAGAAATAGMSNFLEGEDLNYDWIVWGTEDKRLDSSGVIIDATGYRVSEAIPIEYGDYLFFNGGTYPRVAIYDASDDSFMGLMYAGYACDGLAAEMYMRFSEVVIALPSKVLKSKYNYKASVEEYAFFDRNKLAIPINESITGKQTDGRTRDPASFDSTNESAVLGVNYAWYTFPATVVQNKSYFFIRLETPTGELLTFDTQLNFYNLPSGYEYHAEIIGDTGNCVLGRYVGETVEEDDLSLYCYLTNIKDSLGDPYISSPVRVVQINFLTSDYDSLIVWDIMVNGNQKCNSTKYAQIAQMAVALTPEGHAALVEEIGSDELKADKIALENGYISSPFLISDYEQGTIEYSSGQNYDVEYYNETVRIIPFFEAGEVDIITANPGFIFDDIYKYTLAGVYIGHDTISAPLFSAFEAGYKYRFTINRDDYSVMDIATAFENTKVLATRLTSLNVKLPYQAGDIRFNVSVNQDFDDIVAIADAVQDSETMASVSCLLRLPSSYMPSGSPTPLVLTAHGRGWYVAGGGDGNMDVWDTLLANGYALFDVNGDNDNNAAAWGNPASIQAVYKAYKHICENYNIEVQIFVSGLSMGGCTAINFANTFPELVKAAGIYYPTLNHRTVTIGGVDYLGTWEYEETEFATAFGFAVPSVWEPDNVQGYDPWNTNTFKNYAEEDCILFPKPIKFWHGTADTYISYKVTQEYAARVKRTGTNCRFRLVTGAGHDATTAMKTELLYWFNRFN